jgi:hypothetical protein
MELVTQVTGPLGDVLCPGYGSLRGMGMVTQVTAPCGDGVGNPGYGSRVVMEGRDISCYGSILQAVNWSTEDIWEILHRDLLAGAFTNEMCVH